MKLSQYCLVFVSLSLMMGCADSSGDGSGSQSKQNNRNGAEQDSQSRGSKAKKQVFEWEMKLAEHNVEFRMPLKPEFKSGIAPHPLGDIKIDMYTADANVHACMAAISTYPDGFIEKAAANREELLKMAAEGGRKSKTGARLIECNVSALEDGTYSLSHEFDFPAGVNSQGEEFPASRSFQKALLRGNKLALLQIDIRQADYDQEPNAWRDVVADYFESLKYMK